MQRNQGAGTDPTLIWVLGLSLLVLDSATSQDWRDVWTAVAHGQAASSLKTPTSFQGLWRLGGGLLLVFLLALWASASEGGFVFGVTFLLILWVFWLVQHGQGVSSLLNKFTQAG